MHTLESLMSTDAIVLLKEDHTEIRRLFREFEGVGENATKAKEDLVERILRLLSVHTYLENEVMYPGVRELLPAWRTTSWSPTKSITSLTCCAWSSRR